MVFVQVRNKIYDCKYAETFKKENWLLKITLFVPIL